MNKEKIEKIIKEEDKTILKNDKKEDKEIKTEEENTKNTKNVEEKTTNKTKTKEEEKKKHKIGVRTPIYKKMNLSIIGISNKAANEAVMKLNNTDKKILQGAIIDSSYCKIYRKVLVSLYDEKYKDNIASLFSNKNIKCLLEDNESSLALASKLKEEIRNITAVNDRIEKEVDGKEEEIEEVKNEEKIDNKVKEEVVIEEKVEKDDIGKTKTDVKDEEKNNDDIKATEDHSNYDDSWKNYEPKGGSRFLSSLGLKIAFIKNAIITH